MICTRYEMVYGLGEKRKRERDVPTRPRAIYACFLIIPHRDGTIIGGWPTTTMKHRSKGISLGDSKCVGESLTGYIYM